ncbi:MAG: FG-GAP-like repeat-containing protein, partial [Planctomycetota bacterium]|nr:FG-GAP-like repeat-containing protein [Planctomycetota bacterium]
AVEVFGPRAIAAGDFDGDGDNDLALADDDNELIALLTNLGAGVFGPPVTVALGTEPIAIASADLDGDGDLDLAVAAWERPTFRDTVEIVHNNGPAGFSTVASIEIEFAFLTALVVADLNGDGAVDVAVADSVFGCVNVLLNTGGAFAVSGTIAVGDDPEGLAAADLDGDGDFDLATVNRESNNGSILINDGVGNFTLGG